MDGATHSPSSNALQLKLRVDERASPSPPPVIWIWFLWMRLVISRGRPIHQRENSATRVMSDERGNDRQLCSVSRFEDFRLGCVRRAKQIFLLPFFFSFFLLSSRILFLTLSVTSYLIIPDFEAILSIELWIFQLHEVYLIIVVVKGAV